MFIFVHVPRFRRGIVFLACFARYLYYNNQLNLQIMKIKIKGNEVELHYSMRMYIIYENIMGTGIGFKNDLQSYTAALTLFYSAIVASLQRAKLDSNLTYDEFMDWVDEQEVTVLSEFTNWFMKHLDAQADKLNVELAKSDDANPKKKAKKKN